GVQTVETRVVKPAILDVEGFAEPVVGRLVSVPDDGRPLLNQLVIRSGRPPAPGSPHEALLSEPFADAHGLKAGDRIHAVINGNWRELSVVGTALSPEYVYTLGPAALMPDDKRFGVVWMGREALASAFDLDGAFNDITLRLMRAADQQLIMERLDSLLAPYGGIGAYDRGDQASNWFLSSEIEQLETMSAFLPTVFLTVAAFLTNMVLARLIAVERAEIGLLKAFGYNRFEIGWHYVKLTLAIGAVGIVIGGALGYWFGLHTTRMYAEFFRLPFLVFDPNPRPLLVAALVTLGAALLGTLSAVRRAVRLPPAEAMQPPAPPSFSRSRLAEVWPLNKLDQPTRVILRQLFRWPVRSLITSAGIGMAVAVLVTALHWLDALDMMIDTYFHEAQRQDVTVGLTEVRSTRALNGFEQLPGVMATEGMRAVAVRFRHRAVEHRGAIQGVPRHQRLQLVYDSNQRQVDMPPRGLVLSSALADILRASPGDTLTVEVLEGRRPVLRLPLVNTFETYIGTPAYMNIRALNAIMREAPAVSAVHLRVDPERQGDLFRELKTTPQTASLSVKQAEIDNFNDTLAETLLIFITVFVGFAGVLAFGVTYNSSRIALSERGRELATLRVLGFSRAEISYILLGETALLTLVALPLGCGIGYGLAALITGSFVTELYRLPLIIEPSTFGWAAVTGLTAATLTAVVVRRRLDHLDLIAVLKTRE
ncbi:MAG TPA: FtsX-like permease family protein, partial [Arenicellales bacterium]|nr:FtsX-like permease family protein [Arenicellales bacterium]